jgi:hypothetical protein
MSQSISLKEIERKAFRSTFQDGLWDIFLGLLLLNMGIGTILGGMLGETEMSLMPMLWIMVALTGFVAVVLLAFWAGKKFITTPRIGLVKFGPQRKAKMKNLRLVLFLSVLLLVVMFILGWAAMGNALPWWVTEIPLPLYVWPAQTVIVFGLAAYFLDVPRFYAYGVLYGLPFPVGILLVKNTDLSVLGSMAFTYGVPVGVMVLTGVVLFIRFLRKYPRPAEGQPQEGALDVYH